MKSKTNIGEFSQTLFSQLEVQLESISLQTTDALNRYGLSLSVAEKHLAELKDFVCSYKFSGKEEEIDFFRNLKPRFESKVLYFEKLISISLKEPHGGRARYKYYKHELDALRITAEINQDFYRYCISGGTHLDELYFTRAHAGTNKINMDNRFNAKHDHDMALFMATKMVKEHLLKCIHEKSSSTKPDALTWTASKTDLIELIYALQSTEVLKDGEGEIKRLATAFENLFQVNLGNYSRTFQEIRLRKTGRTAFLDKLKSKLEKRMDEFDA
jgi:hypothetical protein